MRSWRQRTSPLVHREVMPVPPGEPLRGQAELPAGDEPGALLAMNSPGLSPGSGRADGAQGTTGAHQNDTDAGAGAVSQRQREVPLMQQLVARTEVDVRLLLNGALVDSYLFAVPAQTQIGELFFYMMDRCRALEAYSPMHCAWTSRGCPVLDAVSVVDAGGSLVVDVADLPGVPRGWTLIRNYCSRDCLWQALVDVAVHMDQGWQQSAQQFRNSVVALMRARPRLFALVWDGYGHYGQLTTWAVYLDGIEAGLAAGAPELLGVAEHLHVELLVTVVGRQVETISFGSNYAPFVALRYTGGPDAGHYDAMVRWDDDAVVPEGRSYRRGRPEAEREGVDSADGSSSGDGPMRGACSISAGYAGKVDFEVLSTEEPLLSSTIMQCVDEHGGGGTADDQVNLLVRFLSGDDMMLKVDQKTTLSALGMEVMTRQKTPWPYNKIVHFTQDDCNLQQDMLISDIGGTELTAVINHVPATDTDNNHVDVTTMFVLQTLGQVENGATQASLDGHDSQEMLEHLKAVRDAIDVVQSFDRAGNEMDSDPQSCLEKVVLAMAVLQSAMTVSPSVLVPAIQAVSRAMRSCLCARIVVAAPVGAIAYQQAVQRVCGDHLDKTLQKQLLADYERYEAVKHAEAKPFSSCTRRTEARELNAI